MAKKTGLGKGLDALFANNPIPQEEEIQEGEVVRNLKLIEIEPNRNQPRKIFDEESLEELASSIKRYGVIQPIIVSKQENYYEIVAGERRWRAAKKAGISEIPAIVRQADTRTKSEIALIENIQRENLYPIEKARGIKQLITQYELTQEQAAEILGMKRSTVANSVRILNLDPRVIDLALEGKLSEGHCKALMAIQDADKQYEAAVGIINRGEVIRDVEKKSAVKKNMKKEEIDKYEAIYRDIQDSFQGFFGTKVKLDAGKRSGKIII